jgi:hypothetical protein
VSSGHKAQLACFSRPTEGYWFDVKTLLSFSFWLCELDLVKASLTEPVNSPKL